MSNYTKLTAYNTKDSLTTGDPLKRIKGTELNDEFDAISTAIATKANLASPTFTGTVVIPTVTIAAGTITGITDLTVADGGTGASTAADARTNLGLAIGTNVQAWDTDLDTYAGKTAPSGTVVGTTDTQTLTNKTLTSPNIGGTPVMNASVLTSGTAVASTSVTNIDFTSIPSWVKRITVLWSGVSTSGTSELLIQIGAGSVTSTGYVSSGVNINSSAGTSTTSSTAGFIIPSVEAANVVSGAARINLLGSNTWIADGVFGDSTGSFVSAFTTAGTVTLSTTLDRIRITTVNGTDSFDAGSINIQYE